MVAVTEMVDLEERGEVAVVTINNPPVNALSQGVRLGLKQAMEQIGLSATCRAVVLHCTGRTFIAGADITEFNSPLKEPDFLAAIGAVEACRHPVVAAIHGTALGGGLETALACHYRVAVPSSRVGLPEVKLGLIPGGGGTQRLPRVVGPAKALDMIVSGEPIAATEAADLGLVDALIEGDLLEGAIDFAKTLIADKRPATKVRDLDDKVVPARSNPALFTDFRKQHARRLRGFAAAENCIKAIEAAVNLPFDEGLDREQALFSEVMGSVQARAQQHIFFAEREAAKIPDIPRDIRPLPVAKAAVLGAGTMGGGISMNFVNMGIPCTMIDVSEDAVERGLAVIRKNYENTAAKGRLTQGDVETRMGLLSGSTDFGASADADIVIEAVFENMDLKKDVFSRLDKTAKPGAILATNTSYLDVNEIGSVTGRPESVIGTHFFSPANVMRLLEVVRGEKTAKDVIATCMGLAKRMGKVPVLVGVCHGFVGNRMLAQRSREADRLILEGASPEQVDRVLFEFGLPMGPFAMRDMAGVDVGWNPETSSGSTIREVLCERGRRGQKTGAGYYDYAPGTRIPVPSEEVQSLIETFAEQQQVRRRSVSDDEILDRCLLPMINEGAKILEENIALRASDIDVVWVAGYGWPVYRGGPMFYADTIGLKSVLEKLKRFEAELGPEWQPARLLEDLAAKGKAFNA